MSSANIINFAHKWDLDSHSINLIDALTHKSLIKSKSSPAERLEFFGDSILSFIVTIYLMNKLPDNTPEGYLSKVRNLIVKKQSLASAALRLELNKLVVIGEYERKYGLQNSEKLLADTYEALLGAIYIDKGLDFVRNFILLTLKIEITNAINTENILDSKTALQERLQLFYHKTPNYLSVDFDKDELNSDMINLFKIQVSLDDKILGVGIGKTKKEAEMNAAEYALSKLK